MIMKKFALLTLLSISAFTLGGCNMKQENNSSILHSDESSESSESVDSLSYLDEITPEEFMLFPDLTMSVNQRLCIDNFVIENANTEIIIRDQSLLSFEDDSLVALKEGQTYLMVKVEDKYQKVNVNILAENSLRSAFNFSQMEKGKKLVSFGDSVMANATIGADLTYVRHIANEYGLNFVRNYAIGGTTATYMFPGSNIDKEYHGNTDAIDGVRVVKQAYDNGELNDVDYAFIAYGHNDHYFQPPITVEGDDEFNIENFDSAYSFIGSYRYMINLLRLANPNIKIIILNCTYSEYFYDGSQYGNKYTYLDYRKAQYQVAEEMDVKIVDPWNYLKTIFDGTTRNIYYKDVVHLTVKGHDKLGTYLKKF